MDFIEERSNLKDEEREQFTLHIDKRGDTIVSQKKDKTRKVKASETWFYLGLIGQIGYTVALPMVVGALIGQYIDSQLHTYPRATLGSLLLGVVISIVGFIQTVKDILNKEKSK
jgi:ATP synthase protein I